MLNQLANEYGQLDKRLSRKVGLRGQASRKECPRAGVAYLRASKSEPELAFETSCKSWECLSCRDRKLGLVLATIQYGLYHRTTVAYLVSVTYKGLGLSSRPVVNPVDAERARKDWRALSRILKRNPRYSKMATFRVVELTERKQIHHHLLIHGVIGNPKCRRCRPQRETPPPYRCSCIQSEWRDAWYSVTKDSWIVDVTQVYNYDGVGSYLCKYLQKHMVGSVRQELQSRGFDRRYMANRNWKRAKPMQRVGTVREKWRNNRFVYGATVPTHVRKYSDGHPLGQQVGDNITKAMARRQKGKKIASLHAKILLSDSNGRPR